MRILALETSTPTVSVALLDDAELIGVRSADVGSGASARILPWAAELLAEAGWGPRDLDAVAASLGPGSFTGLRVGLATAKSLAWSADIALIGESSLHTLAEGADAGATWVSSVLDARRGQVYAAWFEGSGPAAAARLERRSEDAVCDPAAWAAELAARPGAHAVGDGLTRYPEAFGPDHRALRPRAVDLARLAGTSLQAGRRLDPRTAVPNYVRPHGAVPPKDMRG